MKALENVLDKYRPLFEDGGKFERLYPMYEGMETVLLTTGHATSKGSHVRDPMDLKRLMIFVDFALISKYSLASEASNLFETNFITAGFGVDSEYIIYGVFNIIK